MRSDIPPAPFSAPPFTIDVPRQAPPVEPGIGVTWLGLSRYLVTGIVLGLLVVVALVASRPGAEAASAAASVAPPSLQDPVTDEVTRLHGRDLPEACFQDLTADRPARFQVSMEVGLDGKVRHAFASGPSAAMRACLEHHVRAWEFLPQAQASAMTLPFDVDRR
jgi:hypothetical protein